jgi:hypothetical protein
MSDLGRAPGADGAIDVPDSAERRWDRENAADDQADAAAGAIGTSGPQDFAADDVDDIPVEPSDLGGVGLGTTLKPGEGLGQTRGSSPAIDTGIG